MLLLVTILLVVVGTISLVIGFVQSSLLPIYISIACSVLAAAVLLIFSRMTAKSQQVVTSDGGPVPLDVPPPRPAATEPVPAFSGSQYGGSSSAEAFAPDPSSSGLGGDDEVDGELDDDFPIERYDSRRVGEILPLLAELDLDELDLVREREEQGKGRATVLARIDQLIDQLEAEDRHEAASRFDDEVETPAAVGGAPDPELEVLPPAPVEPAATRSTPAVSVAALPEDDGYFPIEEYDDLKASEILPLLPELDDDELAMVRDREQASAARPSILRRIEALLVTESTAGAPPVADDEPEPAPVPDVPAARAAKKTGTRRASATAPGPVETAAPPVKKTAPRRKAAPVPAAPPAKKATVTKKAAPAKTAAKKSAPTSAVPSASATKKAAAAGGPTAKKTTTRKAAATKATATKAGATKAGTTKAAKVTRKAT